MPSAILRLVPQPPIPEDLSARTRLISKYKSRSLLALCAVFSDTIRSICPTECAGRSLGIPKDPPSSFSTEESTPEIRFRISSRSGHHTQPSFRSGGFAPLQRFTPLLFCRLIASCCRPWGSSRFRLPNNLPRDVFLPFEVFLPSEAIFTTVKWPRWVCVTALLPYESKTFTTHLPFSLFECAARMETTPTAHSEPQGFTPQMAPLFVQPLPVKQTRYSPGFVRSPCRPFSHLCQPDGHPPNRPT